MIKKPEGNDNKRDDSAHSVADTRLLIMEIEGRIEDLRIQYEQFFSGSLKLPPDKLHQVVRRQLQDLSNGSMKNSALNFKVRAMRTRYQTLATYWQRVFQARDAGTYHKDVYKANLREQIEQEERRLETKAGKAEKALRELFQSYQIALETVSGKAQRLDYKDFQQSVVRRTKELKQKTGGKKVSFKVVVKDGKVVLQAIAQR